jgi:uncharacterized protein YwqG
MLKRFWNWLLGQTTIDEKIEEKVDNAKRTVYAVREELADVKEAIKDAIEDITEEVVDVKKAAQGKSVERKPTVKRAGGVAAAPKKMTKSALREMKKADLIAHAEKEFGQTLDSSLNKTNLINKVYELHHKK